MLQTRIESDFKVTAKAMNILMHLPYKGFAAKIFIHLLCCRMALEQTNLLPIE